MATVRPVVWLSILSVLIVAGIIIILQVPIIIDPTGDRLVIDDPGHGGPGRSGEIHYDLVTEPYYTCVQQADPERGCPGADDLDPAKATHTMRVKATIRRGPFWPFYAYHDVSLTQAVSPGPFMVEVDTVPITRQCGDTDQPACKGSGIPKAFFGKIVKFEIDGKVERACVYLLPADKYDDTCRPISR